MLALLTTKEIARLLSVTELTVKRMRQRGDGPPFVRLAGSGSPIRYEAQRFTEWLASRTRTTTLTQ